MLIHSPLKRKVKIGDAEFVLDVTFQAKLAFLRCTKTIPGSDDVEVDLGAMIEALAQQRIVIGWSNVKIVGDDGNEIELPFNYENLGLLPIETLTALAMKASEIAGSGNASGSESK
jgi:hypothetical protein